MTASEEIKELEDLGAELSCVWRIGDEWGLVETSREFTQSIIESFKRDTLINIDDEQQN